MIPPRLSKQFLDRLIAKHGTHAVSRVDSWRVQAMDRPYRRTRTVTARKRRIKALRRIERAAEYVHAQLAMKEAA